MPQQATQVSTRRAYSSAGFIIACHDDLVDESIWTRGVGFIRNAHLFLLNSERYIFQSRISHLEDACIETVVILYTAMSIEPHPGRQIYESD